MTIWLKIAKRKYMHVCQNDTSRFNLLLLVIFPGRRTEFRIHTSITSLTPLDGFITRKPKTEAGIREMQYAIALEMKFKRLRYSHTLARPPFCPPSWNL